MIRLALLPALLLPAAAAAEPAVEPAAWICRFTMATEASVDLDGWALTTRGIDHPHRIEIDPDAPARARVVAALDAVPAAIQRGEGILRFVEEAGAEVNAATTVFLVQEVEGAYPAVHTTEQTAAPAFAAVSLHGFCTPGE